MKLAITGKGGVGKTFISALLAEVLSESNVKVFAIDADPDSNLASALGFPGAEKITPLIELKEIIEERTGAKPGSVTSYFTLNPKVDDIPDKFFVKKGGISLAVMGSVKGGGLGCICPESAFLKALLSHLIVERDEAVILDMEAGIEHLGRGTAASVDMLIIVVEPGSRSLETALRIKKLAVETGLKKISVIGNKIREEKDEAFLRKSLEGFDFLGFVPFSRKLIDADQANRPFYELCPEILDEGKNLLRTLKFFKS